MITFESSIGRVIDIEGSIVLGVRQASYLDFENFKIINSKEYLGNDGLFSNWLSNCNNCKSVSYWVAHNCMVEKNIITKFAPYKNNLENQYNKMEWGPWVDTLKIYKILYPNLNNYTLTNLKKVFDLEQRVVELASKFCKRTGVKQHESMYDCIVTYLLLQRINDFVDLNSFLIY
jgi:DNA polymerase III alpha subunit (gram-positive type)